MSSKQSYDAIVIGSGPNGLAAAITLQQAGVQVLLLEAKSTIGGGMRTAELTLPGFHHDVCSAVHPMGMASPFLSSLPLHAFGLEYIHPDVLAAHPFDDGTAAALYRSLDETAAGLGEDNAAYQRLFAPLVRNWPKIDSHILGPMLKMPKNPLALAAFGLKSLQSGKQVAARFRTREAKGLWAGIAAHSMIPLESLTSSAIAFVLTIAGHRGGWPIPKGGSQSIADAMASYFQSLGGTIRTDTEVKALGDLPEAKAILFDTSPKQLLEICGDRLSPLCRWQLKRHRYGMGVFKVDWALSEPVPFQADAARKAGTVHLGGTFNEIADSERQIWKNNHPEKPFVLFAQQSVFDASRAPAGHTGWAYCHVPNGSTTDMTEAITNQVERFAPGFRDTIRAVHTFNTTDMEGYNANYIGGDINGGVVNIAQLFNRPTLRLSPYRTSAKGLYICSASTPPGGGVHGMCGYYAARQVLKDIF
ncbi:phytoene desaturase family protein [Parapedobacter sp. 10938]|uniref:phytoene desaturase family protein n=1 Tax=Parapedobacter flavus TaxID=3110225 RepID=UPI002DBC8837|nr:NAD(P)/FAD-dependent oxidoreductase [Parapedobacter sp. 10938]MEC3880777.1 NAD(P)/FAD-dependent oxidoreductase [Parapedobacter sp. 10938]